MHGTVPRKIARVISSLALNPRYIGRCVTHNLINGRTPLDLEIPWFSYAAIDYLEKHLRPDMDVCEYGTGGSTIFFARRTRSVFSIENDQTYYDLVCRRLENHGLQNVKVELHPFNFKHSEGFEHSSYLHAIPDGRFDVIVVDGSEEWIPVRPLCFDKAEARIKPGGMIVLDDSWRYPQLRKHNRARRLLTFKSVGPCRPGVTSTDIFFY